MTKFVGAEYVIATLLVKKAKLGKNEVTVNELKRYCVNIQEKQMIENQTLVD